MSRTAEAYQEHLRLLSGLIENSVNRIANVDGLNFREMYLPPIEEIDESKLSEKEKCKLLGIPCSYGICDECDIDKGGNIWQ